MSGVYDWAKQDPALAVPVRQRRPATEAGDRDPKVVGSQVAGTLPPREPASSESWPGRGADADPEPPARRWRSGSALFAVLMAAAAAIGTIRFLEWSGLAGTWWALLVLYTVAAAAGVVIAVLARPVILSEHIDDNKIR